jgi:hypothetical protein
VNTDDEKGRGGSRTGVSLRDYIEALLREHEKSHAALADQVKVALASQDRRLDAMNEFRSSLEDQAAKSVSRELFDQRSASVDGRLGAIERVIVGRDVFNREVENLDGKIDSLTAFRAKATGVALVLVLFAGIIGAAVAKAFGG